MNRREALFHGIGAAALAMSARAFGAGVNPKSAAPVPSLNVPRSLIDAASSCEKEGEICLEHCVARLAANDTTLAECARSVRDMLVACRAVSSFAIQRSPHLKEMATVCAKICRECEAACLKHASHHEECRRCGESCKACAAECDKVA